MRLENLSGVFVLADGNEDGQNVYFRGNWVPSGCRSALAWLRLLAAHMVIINHKVTGKSDYEPNESDIACTLAAAAWMSSDYLKKG